ncbi:hypothetical protein KSS87_014174, partial [Heliosperma pusillum]
HRSRSGSGSGHLAHEHHNLFQLGFTFFFAPSDDGKLGSSFDWGCFSFFSEEVLGHLRCIGPVKHIQSFKYRNTSSSCENKKLRLCVYDFVGMLSLVPHCTTISEFIHEPICHSSCGAYPQQRRKKPEC